MHCFEIFTFEMYHDLETWVKGHSRSKHMTSDVILKSGSVLEPRLESLFWGLGLGLEPTGLRLGTQDLELDSRSSGLGLNNVWLGIN